MDGIQNLIKDVSEREKFIRKKSDELASRLAQAGYEFASLEFPLAQYDGINDAVVSVEKRGDSRYAVIANGASVLFIEFGAGITFGYGHPEAAANGMGPGTYPNGKGHWDDPNGWWYKDDADISQHSYGNPPAMPMYNAVKELEQNLEAIAQEVFST